MSRSNFRKSTNIEYTYRNSKLPTEIIYYSIEVTSKYLHVGRGEDIEIKNDVNLSNDTVSRFVNGENSVFNEIDKTISIKQAFSRAGGKYVIPGGTIKGAVRTRLEMSLNDACYIVADTSSGYSKNYIKIFNPDKKKGSENFSKGKICPVCNLFGNMGLASRVSFSDAILTSDPKSYVVFEKIDNEESGTEKKGEESGTEKKGEEYELVKKGAVFEGFIVIRANGIDKGAVYYGMGIRCENDKVEYRDILLGRFKYSNPDFGRVRFKIKNNNDVCKNIKDFVSEYRPKDIREDWK
ncbi:MAG: RAMP superfamily CRISPR-associated protein [Metallosphaera sp.]|uniref:RAMP superfamily CRISPR-associated protein n=1 Tax=Metallosphaera sp. TaxID=2020860 RepID=UPI0031625A57